MDLRESIEYFHLLFSQRLAGKVDKSLFCLKGGCNLRFYFHSIRYSEDIDFDAHTISVQTLKKNVEKILDDKGFASILKHQDIEVVDHSAPKQTETTQRWKVALRIGSQTLPVPTKIEFSRRKTSLKGETVPIRPEMTHHYKLQSFVMQHYPLKEAILQKFDALIHRTETQSRDVVDLKILIGQMPDAKLEMSKDEIAKSLDTIKSISFDDFKSQTWPYLINDFQSQYDNQKSWKQIQEEVCTYIKTRCGKK
jgi:predicted nucleotidyltransferase component of viral defense system